VSVGLEIDAADQSVAQQERQHVIAMQALMDRRVDFETEVKAEQALRALTLPDQRIERR
jgi:hypothetical protein